MSAIKLGRVWRRDAVTLFRLSLIHRFSPSRAAHHIIRAKPSIIARNAYSDALETQQDGQPAGACHPVEVQRPLDDEPQQLYADCNVWRCIGEDEYRDEGSSGGQSEAWRRWRSYKDVPQGAQCSYNRVLSLTHGVDCGPSRLRNSKHKYSSVPRYVLHVSMLLASDVL